MAKDNKRFDLMYFCGIFFLGLIVGMLFLISLMNVFGVNEKFCDDSENQNINIQLYQSNSTCEDYKLQIKNNLAFCLENGYESSRQEGCGKRLEYAYIYEDYEYIRNKIRNQNE